MNKPNIDYREIDKGIRELVFTLNKIPYIATQSSCEGHLKDYSMESFFPDKGHKFLYGGDIIFKIDKKNPKSAEFLRDVQKLKDKHSFFDLKEHHCGDKNCGMEGSQIISLTNEDLISSQIIDDKNNLETIVKKMHQVKTSAGKQRLSHYQEIWDDFLEIAEKYLN